MVAVPPINGEDAARAARLIQEAALTPWAFGLARGGKPMAGTTAWQQDPEAGTLVPRGSVVAFEADAPQYAEDRAPAHMPRVVGMTGEAADAVLAALDPEISRLAHNRRTSLSAPAAAGLRISRQRPLPGAPVRPGVHVLLVFKAPPFASDLSHLTETDREHLRHCQRLRDSEALHDIDQAYQDVRAAILQLSEGLPELGMLSDNFYKLARWRYVHDVVTRLVRMLPRDGLGHPTTNYVPGYIRDLAEETPPAGTNGPIGWAWCAKYGVQFLRRFRARVHVLEDFYVAAAGIVAFAEATDKSKLGSWGLLGDALRQWKEAGGDPWKEGGLQQIVIEMSRKFLAASESDLTQAVPQIERLIRQGEDRIDAFAFWEAVAKWLDASAIANAGAGLGRSILRRVRRRRALRQAIKESAGRRGLRAAPFEPNPSTGGGGPTRGRPPAKGPPGPTKPRGEAGSEPGSGELGRKRSAGPEVRAPSRLPRSNGRWEGAPGNGRWYSENPEVVEVTHGKPVVFRDGRPDFSPWSRGTLKFEPGRLNGTRQDFSLVNQALAEKLGLPNKSAADAWLRSRGLTAHHSSSTTIELVPSRLHNNIPHTGSAADLRMR